MSTQTHFRPTASNMHFRATRSACCFRVYIYNLHDVHAWGYYGYKVKATILLTVRLIELCVLCFCLHLGLTVHTFYACAVKLKKELWPRFSWIFCTFARSPIREIVNYFWRNLWHLTTGLLSAGQKRNSFMWHHGHNVIVINHYMNVRDAWEHAKQNVLQFCLILWMKHSTGISDELRHLLRRSIIEST